MIARWNDYIKGKKFSQHTRAAIDDGYKITHMGILLRCTIPLAIFQPTVRVLMLALEGLFAFVFRTMKAKDRDYGIDRSLRLWDEGEFSYDGLCSHSAFFERAKVDLSLTTEQLEEHAANIDFEQHGPDMRERTAEAKRRFDKARPSRKAEHRAYRLKANAQREPQYCPICDMSVASPSGLEKHNHSASHLKRLRLVEYGIEALENE